MFTMKVPNPPSQPQAAATAWPETTRQLCAAFSAALALPFDQAQAQYARAVQTGLVEPSLLRSRDVARALDGMQKLALGPWARHT